MKDTWNSMFLRWTPLLVFLVIVLLVVMVGFEVCALLKPVPFDDKDKQLADLLNKQLWMRATEIVMGYVVGVLCVWVGIIFVWNSVEASTKVEAGKGDIKLGLTTGSAGIVIVLIGALLVGTTLLSPRAEIGPRQQAGGPESNNPPEHPKMNNFLL